MLVGHSRWVKSCNENNANTENIECAIEETDKDAHDPAPGEAEGDSDDDYRNGDLGIQNECDECALHNINNAGIRKVIKLLFCNISEYGSITKGFLGSREAQDFHGFGFGETHVDKSRTHQLEGDLKALQLRPVTSAAAPTGRSEKGTSGGTVVATRRHVCVSPLARTADDPTRPMQSGDDWSGTILQLKGTPFLWVHAYFNCNEGVSGGNIAKMGQLALLFKELGIPFGLTADFNMEPQELAAAGWLEEIGAEVITAQGITATCSNGGNLLDYAVISKNIASVTAVKPFDGPWGTHQALVLEIPRAPLTYLVRVVAQPRALPPEEHHVNKADWEDAKARANGKVQNSEVPQFMLESPHLDADDQNMARLDDAYAKWSLAAEMFILERSGMDQSRWENTWGEGRIPHLLFSITSPRSGPLPHIITTPRRGAGLPSTSSSRCCTRSSAR